VLKDSLSLFLLQMYEIVLMKIKYIYANYQMLIFLSYKQRFIKNQVK